MICPLGVLGGSGGGGTALGGTAWAPESLTPLGGGGGIGPRLGVGGGDR